MPPEGQQHNQTNHIGHRAEADAAAPHQHASDTQQPKPHDTPTPTTITAAPHRRPVVIKPPSPPASPTPTPTPTAQPHPSPHQAEPTSTQPAQDESATDQPQPDQQPIAGKPVGDALSLWLRDARRAAREARRTPPGEIEINQSDNQTSSHQPGEPLPHESQDDQQSNPTTQSTSPTPTTTPQTQPTPITNPRSRRKLIIAAAAASVVIVPATIAIFLLALSRERPAWWRTVDGDDPKTREAAIAVQNGLATHLTKARSTDNTPPSSLHVQPNNDNDTQSPATTQQNPATRTDNQPWALSLRSSDANAWLNTMLPGWLENQSSDFVWPADLLEVQVEFNNGRVIVGALVKQPDGSRVYSASVIPMVLDDGSLWMPAERVGVGRLPIPAAWVLRADKDNSDNAVGPAPSLVPASVRDREETIGMFRAFAGAGPMLTDASVDLGDGRRVRLLGLRAEDGVLTITCQTEHIPRSKPSPRRTVATEPIEDREM